MASALHRLWLPRHRDTHRRHIPVADLHQLHRGSAKMRLENVAKAAWAQGVKATVFNCPEIRTNSSDIFVGVELSLFPLLKALMKEGDGAQAGVQWQACRDLLQEGNSLEALLQKIDDYNATGVMRKYRDFAAGRWTTPLSWPT